MCTYRLVSLRFDDRKCLSTWAALTYTQSSHYTLDMTFSLLNDTHPIHSCRRVPPVMKKGWLEDVTHTFLVILDNLAL
jgi:hypothetical protein